MDFWTPLRLLLVFFPGCQKFGEDLNWWEFLVKYPNFSQFHRGQKINANFFCTKFFENPSGHGRPRRKSWTSATKSAFSCGPGDGEKLFDPWAFERKGQECPQEIRSKKFMFMLIFFPDFIAKIGKAHQKGGVLHVSKFLLLSSVCLLLP